MKQSGSDIYIPPVIFFSSLLLLFCLSGCVLGKDEKVFQEDRAKALLKAELEDGHFIEIGITDFSESVLSPKRDNILLDYISFKIDSAKVHGDRNGWEHEHNCLPEENWCEVTVFITLETSDSTFVTTCNVYRLWAATKTMQFIWKQFIIWDKQDRENTPKVSSKWTIDNYSSRELILSNQKGKAFMCPKGTIHGTLSNPKTPNTPLTVFFQVEKNQGKGCIRIRLLDSDLTSVLSSTNYTLKVKAEDGSLLRVNASKHGESLIIKMSDDDDDDGTKLHSFLLKHKVLCFNIEDQYDTEYDFRIDATGYTATYNKL